MLIFVARYAFLFWVSIFSSRELNLKLDMEREQLNFYPISACTAKCMQFQSEQQKQEQQRQEQQPLANPLNCYNLCRSKNKTSNRLTEDMRKIHENLILKLVCRDDRSLTFRIDMEGSSSQLTAEEKSYQSSATIRTLVPVNVAEMDKNSINVTSTNRTERGSQLSGYSNKNRNVYVIAIHEAKDAQEYIFYLSDENFFVLNDLKQNTTYNITSVAVYANYEYSVIAKGQQYTTLRRGYTPGKVQDIQVKSFHVDEQNDMLLTAKITWKPSADMTCHYDIICFSPNSLTPLEIRNPRQLYSYNIENLAFSSEYKIGIRAINSNNSSKESDLFWKTFQAPSCVEWYNYNFSVCAPAEPQKLEIEQFAEGEDEFAFNISWQQPEYYPDYYTLRILDLSLEKDNSYIVNISRHQNSIFIPKVKLRGIMFEVHLTAYTPGGNSTAFVSDLTRSHKSVTEKPHIAKLIAAVLAPILCLAILSLTIFIICHRRAKLKRYQERCKYFEELEKKAPIDPKANFDFPTKNLSPLITAPEQYQLEMFFCNDAMEIDRNDLTLHEVLGEGAFGLVRRGVYKDKNSGVKEVAVKMLKDNPSADDVRAFHREIEVMKSVDKHPNIVGIIGHCTKLCNEILLLTEYCSFGNLLNFLRSEWRYLHELRFDVDGTITTMLTQCQQESQQQQHEKGNNNSNHNKNNKSNCKYQHNNGSNNNAFNLDATIIEKIKQKYKYFNAKTNVQTPGTTKTITSDPRFYTKDEQQQQRQVMLLSGDSNKIRTTTATSTVKDMQHIEELLNITTKTTIGQGRTPTTVSTAGHSNTDAPNTKAAAENKSYGYDEMCTNACKCQVDVLTIKDIDAALGQNETEQLEYALKRKDLDSNSSTNSALKIKIANCDCSKVLAKNNRNFINKGYYKYLTSKADGAGESGRTIKKSPRTQRGLKSSKEKSKRCGDDDDGKSYDYDELHESASPSKCVQNENDPLIESVKREPLTALDLLDIARQVAVGMEFLAKNKVVHRDLAARNVLVSPDRTIKIADFGLSRDIYQENMYKKTGNGKLPIKWLALESMTHQVYTTQSDVWSYGILLYEIVTLGSVPYPSIPTNRLLHLLKTGYRMEKPKNCGQDFYNLMYSCWNVNPSERPNFTAIIKELNGLMCESPESQIEKLVLPKDERPVETTNSDDAYLKPL